MTITIHSCATKVDLSKRILPIDTRNSVVIMSAIKMQALAAYLRGGK